MLIDISSDLLFEASALVYGRWSEEYDRLKHVKQETDDGSKDWAEFHKHRLATHTEAERLWRVRKDEAMRLGARAALTA